MKRVLLFNFIILFSFTARSAIITWDGGGGDGLWATAANWVSNVVPGATDDVVLDNSLLGGNYIVTLPSGAINITVNTLTISPNSGNAIRLILPVLNTAAPALTVNQATGDVLLINNGGILENSNNAVSGTVININSPGKIRINNGGRYIHNNNLSASAIVDNLSLVTGTELGVIEYAQAASFALLSNGIIYNSVELTTTGTKAFSFSGNTDVAIKGFLKINTGVTFSSTKNSDILIAGNLIINGSFDLSPTSPSIGMRRLFFNGTTSSQIISGAGNFTFGANFRNIEVNAAAKVILQRGIYLSNTASTFIVNNPGTLQMGAYIINGVGGFQIMANGLLGIGSADGITLAPTALGNVQTATRSFPGNAFYEYNGATLQVTGSGLPTTISSLLMINNTNGIGTPGVILSQPTTISGALDLELGNLTTSAATLLTIADNAVAVNSSLNSFVNGPLKKIGDDAFTFPVGEGNEYAPIGISSGGLTTDAFTAQYFRGNPRITIGSPFETPAINHMSVLEWWTLDRAIGISSKNVTLNARTYSDATLLSALRVLRWDGSSLWRNEGNTAFTGVAVGPVTSGLVSGFLSAGTPTPFTFGSVTAGDNPLPISLLSFNAYKISTTKSSLTWELAAYTSSAAKFEVQRAGADKIFSSITTVNGNETNRLYNYIDNGLKNGMNYYRLKMIDEDGKITYSRKVAVMNGVNGLLLTSLIPTVVTNTASLTVASSRQQKLDIIIVDMQGWVMWKRNYAIQAGNTNIELPLAGLTAGVCQLTGISADGRTNTIRFIRQ